MLNTTEIKPTKKHIYEQINTTIAMLKSFEPFSFMQKENFKKLSKEYSEIIIQSIDAIHYECNKYYDINNLSFSVKESKIEYDRFNRILAPNFYVDELQDTKRMLRNAKRVF